jgi:NADPH-dependent curcumin reductase CurA
MTLSREVHLIERPEGMLQTKQFQIVTRELPEPKDGELLVENIYVSVDPAMRPRFASPKTLNTGLVGGALGRVKVSRSADFREGDLVQHDLGLRDQSLGEAKVFTKLDADGLPLSAYMSVLGLTGLTAYGGLLVTGELKEGETVFVSAAAGAVGSIAAQIAKIKHCFVIGSAGSADKCAWLSGELGLDAAINYKTENLRHALRAAAPGGIDVYFENVGGEHLNAALLCMKPKGRIPVCGMISGYNARGAATEPVTALSNMIYNRLMMRGFVVYEFAELRAQFLKDMKQWLREGRMKYRETILDGLEQVPNALLGLFSGANTGKMLIRI